MRGLTHFITHNHTQEKAARESSMSQRSGFPGLCSLYGWLEVTARMSQLTGPCSDGDQLNFYVWKKRQLFLFNNIRDLINTRKSKLEK